MIILGTVMAIASGVALPGHMLLFGRVINEFVFHSIARALLSNQNSGVMVDQHFCASANSSRDMLTSNLLPYYNDTRNTLLERVGLFSLYYVAMATAVLFATFLATVFWNASAYRQTRRMRDAFYRSILRQDIGWFDVTEANELSTRLVE